MKYPSAHHELELSSQLKEVSGHLWDCDLASRCKLLGVGHECNIAASGLGLGTLSPVHKERNKP